MRKAHLSPLHQLLHLPHLALEEAVYADFAAVGEKGDGGEAGDGGVDERAAGDPHCGALFRGVPAQLSSLFQVRQFQVSPQALQVHEEHFGHGGGGVGEQVLVFLLSLQHVERIADLVLSFQYQNLVKKFSYLIYF